VVPQLDSPVPLGRTILVHTQEESPEPRSNLTPRGCGATVRACQTLELSRL
jgi:hypothetical protein